MFILIRTKIKTKYIVYNGFILDNSVIEPKMSASFVPDHKAPMVLFLDRVYGIDNQDFLLHVLEVGFLPDMRAAASLDTVCISECHLLLNFFLLCCFLLIVFVSVVSQAAFSTTEMALALNRYLCSAVLPLITKCAPLFAGTDHRAIMIDSMLHTIYRLSRGRSLTKAQRDVIEECLMSLCKSVLILDQTHSGSVLKLSTQTIFHIPSVINKELRHLHYSVNVIQFFICWKNLSSLRPVRNAQQHPLGKKSYLSVLGRLYDRNSLKRGWFWCWCIRAALAGLVLVKWDCLFWCLYCIWE